VRITHCGGPTALIGRREYRATTRFLPNPGLWGRQDLNLRRLSRRFYRPFGWWAETSTLAGAFRSRATVLATALRLCRRE
jgi:hypothetical protein